MQRSSTGYIDPTIQNRKVERALPRISSSKTGGNDLTGLVNTLMTSATANMPTATTSQGWTRGEAKARNQSRAIQAKRQAANLLSDILKTQMRGGTQKAVQELSNKGGLDVAGLRERGATERAGLQEEGATKRTGMTTAALLERQRMADEAASGRLGTELGWKGSEADKRRNWLSNEELMKSNRGLVSSILQSGGTISPELGNIYNMPEGFTPNWEGLAGQQLVPTKETRPLGYAVGEKLMMGSGGRPIFKGNKPVYEKYLYNKETGQPYMPVPQQQPGLQNVAAPPVNVQQPAPAPANALNKSKKNYDLNQYFR